MTQRESVAVLDSKSPTQDQIVLHLDMDCFFVACERLRRPALRGEPVVIGGGFDADPPRGAVATASYEAREHGVHSAQPMAQALRNLPQRDTTTDADGPPTGIYLKGDHAYYRDVSDDAMAIVDEYAETVRRVSIDEAYLDITDRATWETAADVAADLKATIADEVGVVASVGVAPTMSCAKIASDHDKPDGLCVVPAGEVQSFLAPLDIEAIHGVGPVAAERFNAAGVSTAGDLAALTPQDVIDRFGSRATTLYDRVRGIDPREVEPVGKPKSISKEKSIEPSTAWDVKEAIVETLAEQVSARVASKGVRYRTVGIKVVETPFDVNTRERSLVGPIRDPDIVESVVVDLLEEFADPEVRKLGVRVSKLDFFEGEQTRLDAWTSVSDHPPVPDFQRQQWGQTRLSDYP